MLNKKYAVRINENLKGFTGTAHFYVLTEPLYGDLRYNEEGIEQPKEPHSFVVVSQANVVYSGWETYIFPAVPEGRGKVSSWLELPGSQKGMVSPGDLLRELGYEVININIVSKEDLPK